MKRSSSDLKALSRETLIRQWGLPIGACLLIFICSIILTMVITALLNPYSMLSIITCQIMLYIMSLFVSVLQAGYMKMHLNLSRKEPYDQKKLVKPFNMQPDSFLNLNLILPLGEVVLILTHNILSYRTDGVETLGDRLCAVSTL